MNQTPAAHVIAHGERLAAQSRTSSRWYVRYLLTYAVASFALSSAFGLVGHRVALVVVTPLWFVVIGVLTVWALRRPTELSGLTGLHLSVIGLWAVAWCVTVTVGTSLFADTWWWWVAGGLAMATPPVVGAAVAVRRTAT